MKEIQIIAGKHDCGRIMDMRIVDVKDDNNNILVWMTYGICKKCNVVLVSNIFEGSEEPKQDIDFIIDYKRKVKGVKNKPL